LTDSRQRAAAYCRDGRLHWRSNSDSDSSGGGGGGGGCCCSSLRTGMRRSGTRRQSSQIISPPLDPLLLRLTRL
jgi:hypothetical protein